MQGLAAYQIEVKGQLDEDNFNATSPIRITVEKVNHTETTFTLYTDQSGLIGLIRFLHQRGFIILSVNRKSLV